jgi:hypothetical protein
MKAQKKVNPLKHFNDVKAAQLKKASKGSIINNMSSLPKAQGGCNFARAQRKNKRARAWDNFKEKAGNVVGGILGAGAAGTGVYFGVKKLKEKQ